MTSTHPLFSFLRFRATFASTAAMVCVYTSLALVSGCGSGGHTVAAVRPVFTSLTGPGGPATTINGISNANTLVGFTTSNGTNTNFLETVAGTINVINVGDPAAGMATAINKSNTIVGLANGTAFSLSAGVLTPIAVPNSTASIAFGINDAGVIVGQATIGTNTPGFVDVNGQFTMVLPVATATVVNVQGVNNSGDAIGFYSPDGVHQHGFAYNISTKKTTLFPDPKTSRTISGGLVLTQFLGINDNGEAVGYYQTNNGSQFGFLFDISKQTYTFLDAPNAAPVNGVQITQITGVSDSGEICGFYIDATGTQFGFTATGATTD